MDDAAPDASRSASRARWAGVFLISLLSIALAEVSIGSQPWGVLVPLNWLLLVPVYGCQVLLLAVIVFRANPLPTLTALWSAGVVMGLYEFYITHVLWDQPWDDAVNTGVAEWPSLIVVAGFWHPFLAAIAPLVLAEQVLVARPTLLGLFPRWVRSPRLSVVVGATILAGVCAGGLYAGRAWWEAPVALGLTAVVVALVVRRVRRKVAPVEHLADALPRGGGVVALVVIVSVLFAVFIVLANTVQPEPLERQAFAVACYAFFVALAAANLRRQGRAVEAHLALRPRTGSADAEPQPARPLPWAWLATAFVVSASVAQFWPAAPVIAIVVIWLGGGALALGMLVAALVNALRRTRSVETGRAG